jgi:CRISPR/Cas system endoribonuclease Cas6 (RAMP superfamily)
MTTDLTVTRRLADVLLERPLTEYVAEKRTSTPRWSWRLIAKQLYHDTDGQVTISHNTLRLWFADDEVAV